MREETHRIMTLVVAVVALVIALFGGIPGACALYEKHLAKAELKLAESPDVFVAGSFGDSLFMGLNTSEEVHGWVEVVDDNLLIEYPGAKSWGALFVTAGEPQLPKDKNRRCYMDFSKYSILSLELKGKKGTSIYVAIKDRHDLDDGRESRYLLKFQSDDWETHEIALKHFPKANLQELNVIACFVFGKTPKTFEVRRIQYR